MIDYYNECMTKLQITLTDQEVDLLSRKAAYLGYDVTKYAKFILAREADEMVNNVPSFKASSAMERAISDAGEEDKQGKTREWRYLKNTPKQ